VILARPVILALHATTASPPPQSTTPSCFFGCYANIRKNVRMFRESRAQLAKNALGSQGKRKNMRGSCKKRALPQILCIQAGIDNKTSRLRRGISTRKLTT